MQYTHIRDAVGWLSLQYPMYIHDMTRVLVLGIFVDQQHTVLSNCALMPSLGTVIPTGHSRSNDDIAYDNGSFVDVDDVGGVGDVADDNTCLPPIEWHSPPKVLLVSMLHNSRW
jgi:hypothetical protein